MPSYRKKFGKINCKKYYEKNREILRIKQQLYYEKTKEYRCAHIKTNYLKNRNKKLEYQAKYFKDQYQTNSKFKLIQTLRGQLYRALRNQSVSKTKSTFSLMGCSVDQLKAHLEKQFKPGMSWNNHGEWHIDHVKPCCSFNLSELDEQQKCFHYSNLQPLWAKDNLIKGSKVQRYETIYKT